MKYELLCKEENNKKLYAVRRKYFLFCDYWSFSLGYYDFGWGEENSECWTTIEKAESLYNKLCYSYKKDKQKISIIDSFPAN